MQNPSIRRSQGGCLSRGELLLGLAFWMIAGCQLALAEGRTQLRSIIPGQIPSPSSVREIIVVFKTHFDIGYTDMASNVVQKYRTTMIDKALTVVEQNRPLPPAQQFIWTIPGWPMSKILEAAAEGPTDRQRRVLDAFKEGRFVVHALPFTTHTELLEPEDLVRGLGYASRLARTTGQPLPRDAKMTDVPCHSWILPTLLKHAGVDFLHLGCNAASSSPEVPVLFWWEGPDGSRLLTMYSAAGYGTGIEPPAHWPFHTWLAMINSGDNHGPPTPEEVQQLLNEARQKLPQAKVRIGRLSDFADAIVAEKIQLPVIRGDMPDTWIHGPMCDPDGAHIARTTRPLISVTESLHTLLGVWGISRPDPDPILAAAREQSLLYGEHTWGGALYWVTGYGQNLNWSYGDAWKTERAAGRFQRLEASWAEHSSYIHHARQYVLPVLADSLQALADATAGEGLRLVVFNPLPWKRDGMVRLEKPSLTPTAFKPADGGDAVPVDYRDHQMSFMARDIPATGYRTFIAEPFAPTPTALKANAQTKVLENEYLRVTLDPRLGGIASVVDKKTRRELVDPQSGYLLGQYLYERFDASQVAAYVKAYVKIKADWADAELGKPAMPSAAEVPYVATSPRDADFRCEQNAVSASAVLEFPTGKSPGHRVTTRVCLYAGAPYLDLEMTVHDKPADDWPEAGWVCLPMKTATSSVRFQVGRLGGIADPARDYLPGANRNIQAVHTGVTLTDASGGGLGFCAVDSPLVSLDSPGIFKYQPNFVPRRPTAFVNLFNNQWTTNFRLWNEGTWTYRFRIWATSGRDAAANLITPAMEARHPLLAAIASGPGGQLPLTQPGLAVSHPGIMVTAFGPNPDGEGLVLRLWEMAGHSGSVEVTLPQGLQVKNIQPVDLRGRPQGQSKRIKRNAFSFSLPANSPASFVLQPN